MICQSNIYLIYCQTLKDTKKAHEFEAKKEQKKNHLSPNMYIFYEKEIDKLRCSKLIALKCNLFTKWTVP